MCFSKDESDTFHLACQKSGREVLNKLELRA